MGLFCKWFQGEKKPNKNPICFVLTDLKAGFKRILFSSKDTSVSRNAGKQWKAEEELPRRETNSN